MRDELAKGPLPVSDVLRRALDFATALNQFHRQGHVHGGITPAAVAVTPAGIQLLEAAAAGTITSYTAPEQLSGKVDTRSDIFAFGAVIYELATGRTAFPAGSEEELRAAILESEPPPIAAVLPQATAVPGYAALEKLIANCLVKNPDRRRQRMQTVQVDLRLMLASAARAARPVAPVAPAAREAPAAPASAAPPAAAIPQPVDPVATSGAPAGNFEVERAADTPGIAAKTAAFTPAAPVVQPAPGPAIKTRMGTAGHLAIAPTEPVGQTAGSAIDAPAAAAFAPAGPQISVQGGIPAPVAEEIMERAPAAAAPPEPRPEPGVAERQAAAILSRVGFGEEPADIAPPPKKKWGIKLKVHTTQAQKGMWVGALKIAAMLIGVAVIAVFVLAARGTHLHLPIWNGFGQAGSPVSMRFPLPAPEQASYMSSPAISPDGKLLVFSAVSPEKKRLLWIRPLNSLHATPLQDTDSAMAPFWSPDSAFIGFFSGKKLKKIAASGGTAATLCDTEGLAGGGAWNKDGVIIFGQSFYQALYRVSANGGTPQAVTRLDSSRGERAHLWPRFLPDGRHFLLYALADPEENNGVSIGSLDNKETRHLLTAETNAIYAEAATSALTRKGFLLFARGRHLVAQPFDASSADLRGESYTIADDISYLGFISLLPMSASDNGLLAFQNIDAPKRQLVWFDRDGNQTGTIGEPGEYGQARISPDGRTVAVNRIAPGKQTADIWLFDVQSNNASQFTAEATHEGSPVWAPDGKSIVYFANPGGRFDIYRKPVRELALPGAPVSIAGGGKEELLYSSKEDKYPTDWSADGRFLLFGSIGAGTNSDLWLLPLRAEGKPYTYLQTVSAEGYGAFSPDGKWIAYQSDETGRAEVYVEQFPRVQGEARRYQISNEGGGLPRWRKDGKEIYYIMGNGKMMAVTVSAGAGFATSPPRMLFQARALPRTWNLYDATRDGSRFLVNTPLEWASSSPITVISNWTEGFKVQ